MGAKQAAVAGPKWLLAVADPCYDVAHVLATCKNRNGDSFRPIGYLAAIAAVSVAMPHRMPHETQRSAFCG